MVVVGTSSAGGRYLRTDYPFYDEDNHLTAGTTKLSDNGNLIPEHDLVSEDDKVGC